jgi:hypothetical protein
MKDEIGTVIAGVAGFDVSGQICEQLNEGFARVGLYAGYRYSEMTVDRERVPCANFGVSFSGADLECLRSGADLIDIDFPNKQ